MSADRIQNKRRRQTRGRLVVLPCFFVLALAAIWIFATHRNNQVPTAGTNDTDVAYAGSASCKACHEEEYRQWAQSHHRMAERTPDPELDKVAFNPERTVETGMLPASIRQRGVEYEIATAGLNSNLEVFHVERAIGVSPLRQFLVQFPRGSLQALDISYDPRSNQWFSVFTQDERRRPGEWGHWTGRGMNWNSMCASCHNTRVSKGYVQALDAYRTTCVEMGVACEACHGPLQAHNEWQRRYGKSARKDPTVPKWAPARATDNCGFCHARRGDLTGAFKPGDDFLDRMSLEIPGSSRLFYSDGQVREEDYEYGPFLGSRMHLQGVQCTDCHNPHSAKTLLPGNWLCMKCHNGSYTNAPIVEPVAHSHHKVFGYDQNGKLVDTNLLNYSPEKIKETGGECVNCHMPQTVYMQRHWRHDHGFTTPDPLMTKESGIPSACNRCHEQKGADWALSYCNTWYGSKMQRPTRQRARVFEAAFKNDPGARPGLLGILATNDIPYWRAVAAGALGSWASEPEVRAALLLALNDTNALVRFECIRALEPLAPLSAVTTALREHLVDTIRGVRIAAAWALRSNVELSSTAAQELLQCLAINADQPGGQMQLGAFAFARGEPLQAADHYQKAVDWDPNSALIRHDYAVVLSTLNRPQEALEQLQAACRLEPANAEFQYKLALAWNELGQTTKTIECLQEAVRLDPKHGRAWYNLGIALNSTGQSEQALAALVRAESVDPTDARSPYATSTILVQLDRLDEARHAAQRALEIDPNFEAARRLLATLAQPGSSSHRTTTNGD